MVEPEGNRSMKIYDCDELCMPTNDMDVSKNRGCFTPQNGW